MTTTPNDSCKFCEKRGLLILPLRYAVVVGEPEALKAVPELPATLGKGVSDLKLQTARYAPRLLRSGYLYVLTDREFNGAQTVAWDAYYVTEQAYLYRFDPATPPATAVEFTCKNVPHTSSASCIAIDKVEFVKNIRLLFTPSPMTPRMLDEYKKNAKTYVAQGKLQEFDPKGWAKNKMRSQAHSLQSDQLATCVPEWQARQAGTQSALSQALSRQLFPAVKAAYEVSPVDDLVNNARLPLLAAQLSHDQGAAFTLFDAIGITQELNDFRNAPFDLLNAFLATADQEGISNQRKLEISQAIEDLKTGFEKGIISSDAKWLELHKGSSDQWFENRLNTARTLRSMGREADAKAIEVDVAASLENREKNYAKAMEEAAVRGPQEWQRKYGKRINPAEISAFQSELRALTQQAKTWASDRAPDHLAWLASERLLAAFDCFDKAALASGFEFAMQHSVCIDGMTCTPGGAQQVAKWAGSAEVNRRNLYLRAFAFNQTELEAQVATMLTEVHAHSAAVTDAAHISGALMLKATKSVVDSMKKVDSAWDEWLRDGKVRDVHQGKATNNQMYITLSTWHKSMGGRTAKWVSELTQISSRAAMANPVDKKLVAVGAAMLYSRMGKLAEKINYETLMLKVTPEQLQERKIRREAMRSVKKQHAKDMKALAPHLQDPLADLLEDARARSKQQVRLSLDQLSAGERPPTNNYHQVRLGVILLGIEGIALANKAQHFKESPRAMAELAASMMSVGSILLDMQYSLAKSIREIEPFKSSAGAKPLLRSLDSIRGGYKLAAGALSTGAGVIGVGLDLSNGWVEGQKDRPDRYLQALYYGRAMMSGSATYFGAFAAVSYCGEWLKQLPKEGPWRQIATWAARESTEEAVKNLVARRTLLLIRVARFNLIGLALTAAEIGWLLYKDNALQDWFDACTFRADKETGFFKAKPYSTTEKEMDALMKARAEVGL